MARLSLPRPIISGDGIYVDAEVASTPGVEQVVLSYAVGVGEKAKLHLIYLNASFSAEISIELNSSLIGSGLIRPSETNFSKLWLPARDIVAGDVIEVKFEQGAGTPACPVRSHLMVEKL